MVHPEPLRRAHPVVLDEHVGVANQVVEHLDAFRGLEIDGHGTLVAVQSQEGRHLTLDVDVGEAVGPVEFADARRFHLDDVSSKIPEVHRRNGAGEHLRRIEHHEPGKRSGRRCRRTSGGRAGHLVPPPDGGTAAVLVHG